LIAAGDFGKPKKGSRNSDPHPPLEDECRPLPDRERLERETRNRII
jgi:hypothetical protein